MNTKNPCVDRWAVYKILSINAIYTIEALMALVRLGGMISHTKDEWVKEKERLKRELDAAKTEL